MIYLCNKNQQNAHFLHCFNLIVVSSTCCEHPSVHLQEDLYMQFYGTSFTHPYKHSGFYIHIYIYIWILLYGCMKEIP